MAINVTLNNISNLQDTTTAAANINTNSNTLQGALPDALSRSGQSPNQMLSALDMNNNPILNLPPPINPTDAVRLEDLTGGTVSSSLNINLGADSIYANPTGSPAAGISVPVSGLLSFAGGALTTQALTGDVVSAGTSTTIASSAVSNAKLASIPANSVIGNNQGTTQPAAYITAPQLLATIADVRGDVLYRGASGWTVLPPGTNGFVLTTGGAGADPSWIIAPGAGSGSGSVTNVAMTVPTRQTVTGSPITTSGTFAITDNTQLANTFFAGPTSGAATVPVFRTIVGADLPIAGVVNANLASMANNTVKANTSGGASTPSDLAVASLMDALGSARGDVLYRGAAGWTVLTPGTAGNHFTTQGVGADPTWTSNSVNTGFTVVFSTGNTVNDTNSINTALSTLHTAGGGTVWLVSPTYTLNAITVPSNCILRGMGIYSTTITASGNPGTFITLTAPGSGNSVMDMTITGSCNMAIGDGNISGLGECRLENLNIDGTGFTINFGISIRGSGSGGYFNRIIGCRIANCVTNAIQLAGSNALEAVLRDINIGWNSSGPVTPTAAGVAFTSVGSGGTYVTMDNVQVLKCTLGYQIVNANFMAVDCMADTCLQIGFNIAYNSTVAMPASPIGWQFTLDNCWGSSSATVNPGVGNFIGAGILLDTSASASVLATGKICNTRCSNNKYTGLVLNGSPSSLTNLKCTITGCVFDNNNLGLTTSTINGEGAFIANCRVAAVGNSTNNNVGGAFGLFLNAGTSGTVLGNTGVNNAGGTVSNNGTAVTTGNS